MPAWELTLKKSTLSLTIGPYWSAYKADHLWGSLEKMAFVTPKIPYLGPGRDSSAADCLYKMLMHLYEKQF